LTTERRPDYGLFIDILLTLERIQAPYMVIGAFAAIIYGARRTTFDIDIVVNLKAAQSDIHQMLVFDALQEASITLDVVYIDRQAQRLGEDVLHFWRTILEAANAAKPGSKR
jgi:hypothetical protein